MSVVHYKFKNSIEYDSITFDGLAISLGDLKKSILLKKRMRSEDTDLQVVNAQNGEEYKTASVMIPKNTSLIIARIPVGGLKKADEITPQTKAKKWAAFRQETEAALRHAEEEQNARKNVVKSLEISNSHMSEMDKIQAMMRQSTKDFDPSNYQYKVPTGTPSSSYICFKCGKSGHFIQNCPNEPIDGGVSPGEIRMKKPTGIPMEHMVIVTEALPGTYKTHTGQYAVPKIDAMAYATGKKERPPFLPQLEKKVAVVQKPVPKELKCPICGDLARDAVVIPCCGISYCDECIRNKLLESEDHVCPSCDSMDVSPDGLIANQMLRRAVTNFQNETGYTKMAMASKMAAARAQQARAAAAAAAASRQARPSTVVPRGPSVLDYRPPPQQSPPPPPPPPRTTSSTMTPVQPAVSTVNPAVNIHTSPTYNHPVIPAEPPTPTQDEPARSAAPAIPHNPPFTSDSQDTQQGSALSTVVGLRTYPAAQPPPRSTGFETFYPPGGSSSVAVPTVPPPFPLVPPQMPPGIVPPFMPPVGMPPLRPPVPNLPPGFTPALPGPPAIPPVPLRLPKPLSREEFNEEKKRLLREELHSDPLLEFAKELEKRGERRPYRSRSRSRTPLRSRTRSRTRSRSRSLSPRPRYRSYSRSPPPRGRRSYSRSLTPRRYSPRRSRSRSPRFRRSPRRSYTPRRSWTPKRSRSRSRFRSYSRSPVRRRSFSRSRSRSWRRSPRRSYSRSPVRRSPYRGRSVSRGRNSPLPRSPYRRSPSPRGSWGRGQGRRSRSRNPEPLRRSLSRGRSPPPQRRRSVGPRDNKRSDSPRRKPNRAPRALGNKDTIPRENKALNKVSNNITVVIDPELQGNSSTDKSGSKEMSEKEKGQTVKKEADQTTAVNTDMKDVKTEKTEKNSDVKSKTVTENNKENIKQKNVENVNENKVSENKSKKEAVNSFDAKPDEKKVKKERSGEAGTESQSKGSERKGRSRSKSKDKNTQSSKGSKPRKKKSPSRRQKEKSESPPRVKEPLQMPPEFYRDRGYRGRGRGFRRDEMREGGRDYNKGDWGDYRGQGYNRGWGDRNMGSDYMGGRGRVGDYRGPDYRGGPDYRAPHPGLMVQPPPIDYGRESYPRRNSPGYTGFPPPPPAGYPGTNFSVPPRDPRMDPNYHGPVRDEDIAKFEQYKQMYDYYNRSYGFLPGQSSAPTGQTPPHGPPPAPPGTGPLPSPVNQAPAGYDRAPSPRRHRSRSPTKGSDSRGRDRRDYDRDGRDGRDGRDRPRDSDSRDRRRDDVDKHRDSDHRSDRRETERQVSPDRREPVEEKKETKKEKKARKKKDKGEGVEKKKKKKKEKNKEKTKKEKGEKKFKKVKKESSDDESEQVDNKKEKAEIDNDSDSSGSEDEQSVKGKSHPVAESESSESGSPQKTQELRQESSTQKQDIEQETVVSSSVGEPVKEKESKTKKAPEVTSDSEVSQSEMPVDSVKEKRRSVKRSKPSDASDSETPQDASTSDSATSVKKAKLDNSQPKSEMMEVSGEKSAKRADDIPTPDDELMLDMPELSKWETEVDDPYDLEPAPTRVKEKWKPEKQTFLPRSVIEKAEKALAGKVMKPTSVASAVSVKRAEAGPPRDLKEVKKKERSPVTETKQVKSPVSDNKRKVYMDSDKGSVEERKVSSTKQPSMKVTVSSGEEKRKVSTDTDLRNKLQNKRKNEESVRQKSKDYDERRDRVVERRDRDSDRRDRRDKDTERRGRDRDEDRREKNRGRDRLSSRDSGREPDSDKHQGSKSGSRKSRLDSTHEESKFEPDYDDDSGSEDSDSSTDSSSEEEVRRKHKHKKVKAKKEKKHKKEKKKEKKKKKHKSEKEKKVKSKS